MPNEPTQHDERPAEEITSRLDRLEALVQELAAASRMHGPDLLAKFPGAYFVVHPAFFPAFCEGWPKRLTLVPDLERHPSEPTERAAPPWRHLVARHHPWRQQLCIKGRNMTVRQLVGTVQANQLSLEEAAQDLDLPLEAIHEALAYAEENADLLRLETEMEALLLKRGKARGSPPVPR